MIYTKTKMKKMPNNCTECRYLKDTFSGVVCAALVDRYKKCEPIELEYLQKGYNYIKPKNCPLIEVEKEKDIVYL